MSSSGFDDDNDSDAGWTDEEEEEDDQAIQLENAFYEADDIKKTHPEDALSGFLKVLELEKEQPGGEQRWRFLALKNIVILECGLGRYEPMHEHVAELFGLVNTVARNDATDAINTIIDAASKIPESEHSMRVLNSMLNSLKDSSNSRLVFNTQSKLAKIYLERRELEKAEDTINEMLASCSLPDGSPDPNKAQSLMSRSIRILMNPSL